MVPIAVVWNYHVVVLSVEWSVARVLMLLLVFVVVAPAVGGLAVCVELDDLPGMIGAVW